MIKFVDYTCPECGHTESDIAVDTVLKEKKEQTCPMCNASMKEMIGGLTVKTPSRTERPFPTHLLGGGDRARFGTD